MNKLKRQSGWFWCHCVIAAVNLIPPVSVLGFILGAVFVYLAVQEWRE